MSPRHAWVTGAGGSADAATGTSARETTVTIEMRMRAPWVVSQPQERADGAASHGLFVSPVGGVGDFLRRAEPASLMEPRKRCASCRRARGDFQERPCESLI